jgi:hypothetical protein
MTTLRFWFRPALLVFFWMVVAAFTLSELATVPPVLASAAGASAARGPHGIRARTYAANRRVVAP